MACPTCNHAMQKLFGKWSWCPRCGTLIDRSEQPLPVAVPKLVGSHAALVASVQRFVKNAVCDCVEGGPGFVCDVCEGKAALAAAK